MRGRAAASLLALVALAAAAPLPAPRTNSTTTGLRPGCVPGWKFAPRRYDWPAGGAPGHAGHWSSRCGYRHTTLHRCGAPLPSAYDCADDGVWTQAPPARVELKAGRRRRLFVWRKTHRADFFHRILEAGLTIVQLYTAGRVAPPQPTRQQGALLLDMGGARHDAARVRQDRDTAPPTTTTTTTTTTTPQANTAATFFRYS